MSLIPFDGQILSQTVSELGEGPSYEQDTDTLWWFDIIGETLHERILASGQERHHALPMMASVVAPVDADRQLLATENGIFIRNRANGSLAAYCELEPGNTSNRSNDGRLHPSGSLWIGTMGKRAEQRAGAIYHVARGGVVTKLVSDITIPNGICFSPDGTLGYYVDTRVNHLMRVPLDPSTGLPTGPATLLTDTSDRPGGMDGSVCDSSGNIWNARWGAGAVDCYAPDGTYLKGYAMPAKQPSCPVFHGPALDRLGVISAWEGLDEMRRAEDVHAGKMFSMQVGARGIPAASFLI
jgi:sugar lactone lactonase